MLDRNVMLMEKRKINLEALRILVKCIFQNK